ncbi:riboflavin synthase [Demequina sp. NBRC 110052]|uniref:riboflavin synthase n=1 Tax=Demequina sp. NBRC 110052 TaxID=1570341 RepID=UPI0009FDE6A9|nr:riboflavin synthase [Demequina sp. NBRC 110052]
MFTGIVESVGTVTAVTDSGAQSQISISSPGFGDDLEYGESIAVNGVCLTVAKHSGDTWIADVMKVTRATTTLADVKVGDRVNLERAMRADGRLGGHMMQGHVDGVAELVARDSQPDWDDLSFRLPAEVLRYVVRKGSIALNGVSLTVAELEGDIATVSLIPTTLAETVFGDARVGDRANVEVDVIGKYVERMMEARA